MVVSAMTKTKLLKRNINSKLSSHLHPIIANTKDLSPTEENLSTWNSNKSKKIF